MSEVRADVEASLVGWAPSTKGLVGVGGWAGDGSEEVHSPVSALSLARVDVEEGEGDQRVADPGLLGLICLGGGREPVRRRVGDEEVVEGSTVGTDLGRVVDERLVGDVVGVDLVLEVGGWVVAALVDESLHHLVLPDVIVGALGGVEVEVGLASGCEGEGDVVGSVAGIDLGGGERSQVRDRLAVGDGANLGAGRHIEGRKVRIVPVRVGIGNTGEDSPEGNS